MSASDASPVVIIEEKHDLPLVRLALCLRTGAAEDPEGLEGLAQFAGELAKRGAAGMSREDLDARFDALGAELSVAVSHDAVVYDVEVLTQHLDTVLSLLADVMLRPDLAQDEAQQLVRETHASLDEMEEDDPQLARRFFSRALYGSHHPYGRPGMGTRASIKRMTVPVARRWIERTIAGGNLLVGAAGDVTAAHFRDAITRRFGVLRTGAHPPTDLSALDPRPRPRITLVDKPGRTQSQILIGQIGVPWNHPDFTALSVAVSAFGGTFTSRLMTEVRVKRGLSYGVSARLGQGRGPRPMMVYVFPSLEQTGETLGLVLDLWREWVEKGLTDDELRFAVENMANSFVFETVTPEDRLDLDIAARISRLPDGFVASTVERVRSLRPDDVREAMGRHLLAEPPTITVLGTASKLEKQIGKLKLDGEAVVESFDKY